MKRLGLVFATLGALAVAGAPALAETTVIKKHHGMVHKKVVIKKHGDGVSKTVIKKQED